METAQTGSLMHRPDSVNADHVDDSVLQISGAGHWFLEGWIGDHSVEFLVDSHVRLSISDTGPRRSTVGALGRILRTLRCANGTRIGLSGCSHCVVSLMGLQTEFPTLVCNLTAGTDAIVGTDTLGSVLPHTLDINNGLLFTDGGVSLQLHWIDTALSSLVFTVGHCSIPPYSEAVFHCPMQTAGGRPMPSRGLLEDLTFFAKNTGLVVARTHPSKWSVPVIVSNFSQDTVMVGSGTDICHTVRYRTSVPTFV